MAYVAQDELRKALERAATSVNSRALDFLVAKRKYIADVSAQPYCNYVMDVAASLRTPEFEQALTLASDFQTNPIASVETLSRIFRLAGSEFGWWAGVIDHCHRVGRIAGAVAKEFNYHGLSEQDCFWGGVFHDIGKLFIGESAGSEEASSLPRDEIMVLVRTHAPLGAFLLEQVTDICPLAAICAKEHHEDFNGQGYPMGLRYADISLSGYITLLSDRYDAAITRRDWKMSELLMEFRDGYVGTGTPEDDVFKTFIKVIKQYHKEWYQEAGK